MGGPQHAPAASAASAIFRPGNGVQATGAAAAARHESTTSCRMQDSTTAGMEGGAGEFSYTRNSCLQSQAIDDLRPILKQAISEISFDDLLPAGSHTTVRVADLGCSLGANTLQYADICFQTLQECFSRCSSTTSFWPKSPAVQYFFSDLPSNDFNTLFQQLEDWRQSSAENIGDLKKFSRFYAAAAPGSFYGPLFPPASLHIVISTYSLQWLPQVPDAVMDKDSAAYNQGRVWIDGIDNPAVLEAFVQAAGRGLRTFLQCRAEEVVSGGVVVIYIPGRTDAKHPEVQWPKHLAYGSPYSKVFEATWEELVVEGIIEEERRDSFNLPIYLPSVDEVRAAAESTDAYHIRRLEVTQQSYFSHREVERLLADPEAYGQFMRNLTKSFINSSIVDHIGEEGANEFFERLGRNAAAAVREKRIPNLLIDGVVAVLVRK